MKSRLLLPFLMWPLLACEATSPEGEPSSPEGGVREAQGVIALEACEIPEGLERFELLSFVPPEPGESRVATLDVEVADGCGQDYYQACWNRRFEDRQVHIVLGRRHELDSCQGRFTKTLRLDMAALERELAPRVLATTSLMLHLQGGRRLSSQTLDEAQDFRTRYAVTPPEATELLDITATWDDSLGETEPDAPATITIEAVDSDEQRLSWVGTATRDEQVSLQIRPGRYRLSATLPALDPEAPPWGGFYPDKCEARRGATLLIHEAFDPTQTTVTLTLYRNEGRGDPCHVD